SSFIQPPPAPTALSAAAISALYGNALSAQPQPPSAPPETPPNPGTPNGQGGQGGQLQTPDGHAQQVTLDNPANAEQVAQFVTSVLNQIQNPDVVHDVLVMLGDLSQWTILAFEGEQRSLNEILTDMDHTNQQLWDLANADATNDDAVNGDTNDAGGGGDDSIAADQPLGGKFPGTDGNDVLHGTPYDDTIWGNAGDDTLYGDDGNDTLGGGDGADTLYGDGGDDLVVFSRDTCIDTYYGGAGSDTLSFSEITGVGVTIALYTDAVGMDGVYDRFYEFENVIGTNQGDQIDGNGSANVIRGLAGDDIIYGNGGADVLYGDAGNDYIYGDQGNDTLYGGDGNDLLSSGDGNDVLTGGAGADTFRFGGGIGNEDIVVDFNAAEDTLETYVLNSTRYDATLNPHQSDGSVSFAGDSAVSGPGVVFYQNGANAEIYYNTGTPSTSYQIATIENTSVADLHTSGPSANVNLSVG
ncbi:MAG: calcium-binding protein, partial [Bacteroidales bacterium]